MTGKEFQKIETEANTDENGNISGWQELSDQPPEYWSEEAMREKPLGELYPKLEGERSDDYNKRLEDIDALMSDENDENAFSEAEEQYSDDYPYGRKVYENDKPESGQIYTYGEGNRSRFGYKFIEHVPNLDYEFRGRTRLGTLLSKDRARQGRFFRWYSRKDRMFVLERRRRIEESNSAKTREQLLRDKVSKAFELYFSQLTKLGFFDMDEQKSAECIYPSEYDDYHNGTDTAAIIPIETEDDNGERTTLRLPITFDLTTGLSKEERIEDLMRGNRSGFTSLRYSSAESGARIEPKKNVPNFVIYLPLTQAGSGEYGENRYESILDRLSKPRRLPNIIDNGSRLEEFLSSMGDNELPSQEIQDLINYQISWQANLYRRRWDIEIERLLSLGQDDEALDEARKNSALFKKIGEYFDGRISGERRIKRIEYLRQRNPLVFDFFDMIKSFLQESEDELKANSYSASPEDT